MTMTVSTRPSTRMGNWPMLGHNEVLDRDHRVHRVYPWAREVYSRFAAVLEDKQRPFPCVFGRTAHRRGGLSFVFAESPENAAARRHIRRGLLQYLSNMDGLVGMEASMRALIVFFRPVVPRLSLRGYHRQAWGVMQDWIDHDPEPWPAEIPIDPDDSRWSLCFRGVPLFVNVSCPAHEKRRSRNVGPSLTFILQPRAGFDLVAGNNQKGDAVRQKIRGLMQGYDGQPAPAELGTYGRPDDREWWQYVLQEENGPRLENCPLRIEPDKNETRSWPKATVPVFRDSHLTSTTKERNA